MNFKKIIMYITIITLIIVILIVGYYVLKATQHKKVKEYIPEEEISEKELRKTVISLYFLNNETYQLSTEKRQIDSKELVNYPYEVLINLLIEGPKSDRLKKLIPEGTKLINTKIDKDILFINFSNEFVENPNLGIIQEELIVQSIVNTVTELTEINKIIILIDGEENRGFPDNQLFFSKVFTRQ